jgi:hypothetical protein
MEYLVLRGLDEHARADGDIDVLASSGCSGHALFRVAERAVNAGWTVAGVRDIGYLTQICLVQRWGEDKAHRAVKVDFFNGAAWMAVGQDPLGNAIFEGLYKTLSEAEAVGLATLLQKMLYAGYLRDRDRDRIAASCAPERIKKFIDATGLPLSRADLDRGRLSSWSRWHLRAASAGVGLAGIPGWSLRVIWRKLQYTLVRSTIPGQILLITGADSPRRTAVIARVQSILESAGFPSPPSMPDTETGSLRLTWRRFRGETVVLQPALTGSTTIGTASLAHILQVKIPKRDANLGDDLETVLAALSQHILETLREKIQL